MARQLQLKLYSLPQAVSWVVVHPGEHLKHSRVRGRRRRNRSRIGGVVLRSIAFLALVAGCVAGVRWLNEPRAQFGSNHGNFVTTASTIPNSFPAPQVQSRSRRVVYPYSVVPGGVASREELRQAAEHDSVVSEHYSGFDYKRARIVEVDQPKLVYLSYRRGDHIFWTRKQASLHKGEKLLTDGHITARTRCGNQVSVLPQANTSPQEPTMAELDRPDSMASGMERALPSTFDSKLLDYDPGLPFGPSAPGTVRTPGNAFAGGPPPGGFMPMPIGGGGVSVIPTTTCPPGDKSAACTHNPPPPPPPPPPPAVPEPGTFVLMTSGAAAVLARMRHKKA